MSNAAKFVAFVSCAVVLLSAMGEGCYQPSTPRLTVHAKNLSGLIVNHEKPWAGAQVSLREWPGMYIDD